jgi:DNA-binding SARP family transcriptional activator
VMFSVTYPARVAGLILHATAARITETENYPAELRERHRWGPDGLLTGWGTPDCRQLAFMGPSGWADPSYRAWHTRYQRHCATPTALRELMALTDTIDVRDLLASVAVPTLVLHVRDDPCIPVERARQTAAMIPGARFAEHDGADHIPHIGNTEWWLQEVERFVTGREPATRSPTWTGTTRIRTFGGFAVERDGETLPVAAWGSRQARLLRKRLAAAAGRPVRRDELIDLLWPDDDTDRARLSARLSVQLSTVRRLLDGGVIADRDSVRLDLGEVSLDLAEFERAALDDRTDDLLAIHDGEFLPEEAYEQWAIERRDWARSITINALRAHAADATAPDHEDAIAALRRLLQLDGYDVEAHLALIASFQSSGRHGEAQSAADRYRAAMDDLGIEATIPRGVGTV